MINIDELISRATKENSLSLPVYRLIKAEFLRWTKDNPGKDFNEAVQTKLLKKMYDQRMESFKIYKEAGRMDLADGEMKEAGSISPFLPKEASPEEIEEYTRYIIDTEYNGNVAMNNMKFILSKVQEKYSGASGKIVSNTVKSYC